MKMERLIQLVSLGIFYIVIYFVMTVILHSLNPAEPWTMLNLHFLSEYSSEHRGSLLNRLIISHLSKEGVNERMTN